MLCSSTLLPTSRMSAAHALAIVLMASVCPISLAATTQVNKCVINGTVTYQTVPCPSGEARRAPTVEQLNAERQKKLQQSGASAPGEKEPPTSAATPAVPAAPAAPRTTSLKCDGRKHCSQMKSCAEAKYFLANCPGVKMDGDRNGIPCEQQWCNK